MNYHLIALLLFFVMTAPNAAEVGQAVPIGGFAKVDFKRELSAPGMRKLIGAKNGSLFFAKADGSVEMVDGEGKLISTLQPKEGKVALLEQPEAVAVEGDIIYVVDSETNQVVMYGLSDGKYLGSFGGKASGAVNGALKQPQGVAVLGGVVYVSDTGKERIQTYGVNGMFLNTLPISLPAGMQPKEGSGAKEIPYKLSEPTDIALDIEGRIYVRDADDDLIKIYSASGEFIKTLPKTGKLAAMSVAEDGIYVADEDAYTIHKYDFEGNLAYNFGSKGEGKAQFKSMAGLAIDRGSKPL